MSKDLVKQENTAVAKQQAGGIGRGFERMDMESVSMPRVKVMQGLSPELQDETMTSDRVILSTVC